MRLLTHNMLQCNIKGVKNGYPLGIEFKGKETEKDTELALNIDLIEAKFKS